MTDIFNKLSSYNIFNYLLPGTLFAIAGSTWTSYSFFFDDILIAVFAYYFMGLVISRVGSLMIEPVLIKVGFLKFATYADYVNAAKSDQKIDDLSETKNVYRTLSSLFIVLAALIAFDRLSIAYPWLQDTAPFIGGFFLLVMFLFAYQKQTNYIVKRVNVAGDNQQ